MEAGKFNERVSIMRKEIVVSDYGIDKENWETIRKTKASVQFVGGDRETQNKEVFYSRRVIFTVHFFVDVTEDDRIGYDNDEYRILSIDKQGDTSKRVIVIETEKINK